MYMYLIVFTVFYLYIGSLVSFYDYLFIHVVTRTYTCILYHMHIAQYCANKQLNYENVYDLMDLKMCTR